MVCDLLSTSAADTSDFCRYSPHGFDINAPYLDFYCISFIFLLGTPPPFCYFLSLKCLCLSLDIMFWTPTHVSSALGTHLCVLPGRFTGNQNCSHRLITVYRRKMHAPNKVRDVFYLKMNLAAISKSAGAHLAVLILVIECFECHLSATVGWVTHSASTAFNVNSCVTYVWKPF